MEPPEFVREPCPDRIIDDIGVAFCMGTIGASLYQFPKGMFNHPSGGRLSGGVQAVRMNAPRIGGSFAVWSGLFSLCDCSMVYARQKEDPWNSIISGAATGGILSMRKGFRASAGSALMGGAILTMIEGLSIVFNRAKDGWKNEEMLMENAASVPYPYGVQWVSPYQKLLLLRSQVWDLVWKRKEERV